MKRLEELVWEERREGLHGFQCTTYVCEVEGYRAAVRLEPKGSTIPISGLSDLAPMISVTLKADRYVVFPFTRGGTKAASGWTRTLQEAKEAAFALRTPIPLTDLDGLIAP